ncbi:MAG: helix-turn-helix domain-containing protein, partial [Myxococcales bacterium]|nr:helix-turn-helix domain-containing protein [Myxococcales bacterium]
MASPSDDAQRAALALRRGDPLAALSLASRAGGALGLAIRGAALAQLEEDDEAERCLREAARSARASDDVQTAARAELALVELALARRDLAAARRGLGACEGAFARDPANAVFVAVLRARLELLQRRPAAARESLAASRGGVDAF